jgi:hypothetical protein
MTEFYDCADTGADITVRYRTRHYLVDVSTTSTLRFTDLRSICMWCPSVCDTMHCLSAMLCTASTMYAGSALTVSVDVVITSAGTAYTPVHVL